jgi:hypothetical protein
MWRTADSLSLLFIVLWFWQHCIVYTYRIRICLFIFLHQNSCKQTWFYLVFLFYLIRTMSLIVSSFVFRRSTYNHLSSWLTDARNLTNPNTVCIRWVQDSSHLLGTDHFLRKIRKNALVGLFGWDYRNFILKDLWAISLWNSIDLK